ncbi:hypothetical protein GCM10020331_040150 [Ectobacillus funiculus]
MSVFAKENAYRFAKKSCVVFGVLAYMSFLYGQALQEVIRETRGEAASYYYTTLRQAMNKGYALGFIGEEDVLV